MKKGNEILRDDAEPTMRQGAVFLPMWIVGLFGVLVYLAFNYVGAYGGNYNQLVYEPFQSTNQLGSFVPRDEEAEQRRLGERVYGKMCINCHQPHGGGAAGQYPPLAGSEWVNAVGPNRLIRIPLLGLMGPIKVKDTEWNLNMPAMAVGGQMTDEEVAAVLTYIRKAWGNNAPAVTTEQVQKVHVEIKDRTDQTSAEELLKLPETP
jgi:mono/diheme cytochrome c family protein